MNQTRIEWTDWTVNPVVGCTHKCNYCYARRFAKRRGIGSCCYDFIPHHHLERLYKIKPNQKHKKIFIDSMWDWNCKDNKEWWLHAIIEKMQECSQHTFQILSKRPKGYSQFKFPKNVWIGTSVNTMKNTHRIDKLIAGNPGIIKFVSVEPIHSRIEYDWSQVDWVIIGAETGNRRGKIVPEYNWIASIVNKAKSLGVPVFIKDNAYWPEVVREFPA